MAREPVRTDLDSAVYGAVADEVPQNTAARLGGRRRHPHRAQFRRPEPDRQREFGHPGPGPAQQGPWALNRDSNGGLALNQARRRLPAHRDLQRRFGDRLTAERERSRRPVGPLFEQHRLLALNQFHPDRTESPAAGLRHRGHDRPGADSRHVGPDRHDGFRPDANPQQRAGGNQGRDEDRRDRRPGRPASPPRFQANGFPSRKRQDPRPVSRPESARPSFRPGPRSSRS